MLATEDGHLWLTRLLYFTAVPQPNRDERDQGCGVNVGTYRIGCWSPQHQHENDYNGPRPLRAV
jgi:hypothetical protein